jgi:hypothetical protein
VCASTADITLASSEVPVDLGRSRLRCVSRPVLNQLSEALHRGTEAVLLCLAHAWYRGPARQLRVFPGHQWPHAPDLRVAPDFP